MSEEEMAGPLSSLYDETAPRIRTVWYEGKLHSSLIDIVAYLKVSKKPARSYWAQLKHLVKARRKGRHQELPGQSPLFDRTEPGDQQSC